MSEGSAVCVICDEDFAMPGKDVCSDCLKTKEKETKSKKQPKKTAPEKTAKERNREYAANYRARKKQANAEAKGRDKRLNYLLRATAASLKQIKCIAVEMYHELKPIERPIPLTSVGGAKHVARLAGAANEEVLEFLATDGHSMK